MSIASNGMKETYLKVCRTLKWAVPTFYKMALANKLVIKYFVSGVSAAATDLLLLYIFAEYVFHQSHYLLSVALAFVFSFFVSFFLQKFWTFEDNSWDEIDRQIPIYFSITAANLAVNLGLMYFFVTHLHIWYIYAQVLTGALIAGFSILFYARFVFRTNKFCPKESVLICAGIFTPDIGGPATHAENYLKGFVCEGYKTTVVTYSSGADRDLDTNHRIFRISRSLPFGVRHFYYFARTLVETIGHKIIYAQDITAAGIPAFLASKILDRRFFVRIGGDLLWERLAERGKIDMTMREFYASGRYKKKLIYRLGKFLMNRADKVIVSSDMLFEIYTKFYGISANKIIVIKNPLPEIKETRLPLEEAGVSVKKIIFAGRLVKYRNLDKLISAFAEIHDEVNPAKLFIYGEGPEEMSLRQIIRVKKLGDRVVLRKKVSHSALLGEIRNASVCVLPSLSDCNPNFILECLSSGRPSVITRENGLSIALPEKFTFDPKNIDEMKAKLLMVLNDISSAEAETLSLVAPYRNYTWNDIIKQHIQLFNF